LSQSRFARRIIEIGAFRNGRQLCENGRSSEVRSN
jgi:hypothetical protein